MVKPFKNRLKSHWFSFLLTSLLLLVAITKYRGGMIPMDGIDLATPYAGARAWLAGENPYDGEVLRRHFEAGGGKGITFNTTNLPPIYPPITFVVMAPISLLSWDRAIRAWELAAPVMVILLAGASLKLAGLRIGEPRAWLFVLFCLVFAPLRSAITLAQNALPAVCLATLAALVLRWRMDALSGTLLALAVAFKLQDSLFVLVYLLLTRRWRAIVWCAGVLAALSLIALFMPGRNPRWVLDVLFWIREGSRPGAIMDPAPPNPARFQMIHLSVLLFTFLSQRLVATVLSGIVCGAMLFFAGRLIWRRRPIDPQPDLLSLGCITVLSLLPFYHRFPDAIVLLLPMAWAINKLGTLAENQGRITLLLLLPFLVQPFELLRNAVGRGLISRATYESWWFQCFVRASLVWTLLFLACWLLLALKRQGETLPPAPKKN